MSSKEKSDKKKSSSSSKKKEKSSKSKSSSSPPEPQASSPSGEVFLDAFDHGRLFARYFNPATGTLSRPQFQEMLRDLKVPLENAQAPRGMSESCKFNAGMLFEKYKRGDGISQEAFGKLYEELMAQKRCGKWLYCSPMYRCEREKWVPGCCCPKEPTCETEMCRVCCEEAAWRKLEKERERERELERKCMPGCLCNICCQDHTGLEYPYYCVTQERFCQVPDPAAPLYSSPLPHLSTLPGQFDDAGSALLRRDFLHLQGLLEATLAPRIESEVRVLERVEQVKHSLRKKAKEIEDESRAELDRIIKRLKSATEAKCSTADKIGKVHRRVLEKISQFQYLAAGPRPRDALRMDSLAAHLTHSLGLATYTADGGGQDDPVIATLRKQRERAKRIFLEQEHFPHPIVMRDFVTLFKDFQEAAQKLVDIPYSTVESGLVGAPLESNTPEKLDALLKGEVEEGPLPREVFTNKKKARETDRLEEELKLKDQMIYTLVQEREEFERQKQEFLREVDDLAKASAEEIKSWADLHSETTKALHSKIAALQEQNRVLQDRLGL